MADSYHTAPITVSLSQHGDYWSAFYYDRHGTRRCKRIGIRKGTETAKRKKQRKNGLPVLSKQQATKTCQQLAVKLNETDSFTTGGTIPKLGEFIARYKKMRRHELSEGTLRIHDLAGRYLIEHFGENIRLNRIRPEDASAWRMRLADGELDAARDPDRDAGAYRKAEGDAKSEATVCSNTRAAKTIFQHAVNLKLISENPFAHLNGQPPLPDNEGHYVDRETFRKILMKCPNLGWKVFIALQRLGGLRRQEAYNLPLQNVDLERKQIKVVGEKIRRTAKRAPSVRFVPINAELEKLIIKAIHNLPDGSVHLVSREDVPHNNWEREFKRLIKSAKVAVWRKPFQCLRESRATELAEAGIPQHIFCAAMGHSVEVANGYYIRVQNDALQQCRKV